MYDLLIQKPALLQLDGPNAQVLPAHDIAIADERIAAIAPTIDSGLARTVIDAQGMLAIPGLINTHAHTAMALFRGIVEDVSPADWFNQYIWPMEANLTAEDVYWGALLGLAEMIESGITAVADHYFAMDAIARAVEQAGVRGNLAWTVFGGMEATEALQRTVTFVERWNGAAGGRITTWLGPHSPYTCTPDFLALVAQQAQALNVGIHIHVAEEPDQVQAAVAQYGRTPIQLLHESGLFAVPAIAAHAAHPEPGDLELLRADGVGVACCPKTSMKLGMGVAPVVQMRQAGIAVGLGTDGAASNNSCDILETARLIALLQKHTLRDPQVLPIGEALALAMREGARVLGMAGVVGELQPGTCADIALLRLDPTHLFPQHNLGANLLYSAHAGDVDTVLVAGRPLMRARQLLTIDKPQVIREVATRMARLIERHPERRIQTYTV